MGLRVFLTHNAEDRAAYYGRALPDLQALADVTVTDRDLSVPELIAASADCDIIVAHRSTAAPSDLFAESPRLLAFLRCAVDISTVDVAAAGRAGVLVARAAKSFIPSTAELALALMLDLARNVSRSTVDYQAGREPPQRPGRQLRGATAGIIGYGAVGEYLGDLLLALGMRVLVHDPYVVVARDGIASKSLSDLLAEADFVLPLAQATEETTNLIGPQELTAMRPGAVLVNVARGELIDEAAVAAGLADRTLGGLAMDVGRAPDQRPSPELAARPGVVATPHLGGLTPENADAQAAGSVEQVAAIISGHMPPRAVNPEQATRLVAFWEGLHMT